MQATTAPATSVAPASTRAPARPAPAASAYQGYQILRRNGAVVSFEPNKIAVALMKAFLAVHGTQGAASASVRETVDQLTETVVRGLCHLPRRIASGRNCRGISQRQAMGLVVEGTRHGCGGNLTLT